MKKIKRSKVILERGYIEDRNSTDEYIPPSERGKNTKNRYVIYMDVSEVDKKGKKMRPRTAGFTNSPFNSYDEAIKQATLYAKQKYPNDSVKSMYGDPGKNNGFVLVESKKKPTQDDLSAYIIKFWIKFTDYYHGEADQLNTPQGSTTNGSIVVQIYTLDNVAAPSNQQGYPTEESAIKAIRQVATGLQRTLYRAGNIAEVQDKGEPAGSAVVVRDKTNKPRILLAINGTSYQAQGGFLASGDKKNTVNKRPDRLQQANQPVKK